MPWYGYVISAVATGLIVSYWSWVGLSIIRLYVRTAALERHMLSIDKESAQRLASLDLIACKLDSTAEGVQKLIGYHDGQRNNISAQTSERKR